MSDTTDSIVERLYSQKLLEVMTSKIPLFKFLPVKPLSEADRKKQRAEYLAHEKKLREARKVLKRLGVSAGELCDCDY